MQPVTCQDQPQVIIEHFKNSVEESTDTIQRSNQSLTDMTELLRMSTETIAALRAQKKTEEENAEYYKKMAYGAIGGAVTTACVATVVFFSTHCPK